MKIEVRKLKLQNPNFEGILCINGTEVAKVYNNGFDEDNETFINPFSGCKELIDSARVYAESQGQAIVKFNNVVSFKVPMTLELLIEKIVYED